MEGHWDAGKAEASRTRLEAQLAQMARTDPEELNALIQDEDGTLRSLLVRFQIDLHKAVPVAALDKRSLQLVALLAPYADLCDDETGGSEQISHTARATLDLKRLGSHLDSEPEA